MSNPILCITDGTTRINLLNLHGWLLKKWFPVVAEPKGGGVFRSSPLTDGRKLSHRKMDNVIDTFNLVGEGGSEDEMIIAIQDLERLLEKAVAYWTTNWQNEPVWIEARASKETKTRYATIVDYRLTGFGGPFEQPFFTSDCKSVTEAILAIEHTFWQETEPGASGECVQVSSQYIISGTGPFSYGTYYPVASASDGTFSPYVAPAGDLTAHELGLGIDPTLPLPGDCQVGIIFDNVAIPQGAIITKAELIMTQVGVWISDIKVTARGQLPQNGIVTSVFSGTNADFTSRVRTSEFQISIGVDGGPAYLYIANIIQEIISSPYWASGDNLGMFLTAEYGAREYDSFDEGADFPALYIEYYPTGVTYGKDATCNHEIFVTNKQNRTTISDIYVYDADGGEIPGNWSSNLLTVALPYDLLPSTPEVGDRIYFGSNMVVTDALASGGPFSNIIFDLSVIQAGVIGTWGYHDAVGDALFDVSGLTTNELCGDQQGFLRLGVGSIVFAPPPDWTPTVIHGIEAYWVFFEVTQAGTVPPKQQNIDIYTALNPYIDIDEAQVPGDIPPLARILFDSAACSARSMNTLVAGVRSLSRGEDFAAYLNASDVQNPIGVAFAVNTDDSVSIESRADFPTGRATYLNGFITAGVWNNICSWTLVGDLAKQYIGTYHGFIRGQLLDGRAVSAQFRLRAVFGDEFNVSYSDTNTPTLDAFDTCLDVGQLTIQPANTIRPNDEVDYIKIYLDAVADLDNYFGVMYIFDIVLIPADEWIGCFGMPTTLGSAVMQYGNGLDIDAITNPRQYRATETTINTPSSTYIDAYRTIAAEWTRVASSEPVFQANSDQRVWFTQYQKTYNSIIFYFEDCGKVCAQRSARYLLARGNR